MLGKFWRWMVGVPQLLGAVETLRSDVKACFQEAAVQAAWKRFTSDPAVAAVAPRLAAEWRGVEEAVQRLK